jgi:hypothetical protein
VKRCTEKRKDDFEAIEKLPECPPEVQAIIKDLSAEQLLHLLKNGGVKSVDVLRYFQKKVRKA